MAEAHKFTQWGNTCEEMIKTQFPLHRACRDGDVQSLSSLLSEGQHGVYIEDGFYGWTPAHWAAYFGKLNCIMLLHESGVNCDSATIRLNQTPIHIAAFAGQGHCMKWLLHCGARIDRQLACLRKLMQVTRVGADCDIKSSRFCQTPAHLAAFGGHPQCLQWLIQAGASVDLQDYLGETPAHKAARTGSMECCSLLVSHGARLYIRNNNGATPADIAHNCGYMECAKYMEAAARQQDSDAKGVYAEQQQNGSAIPNSKDITSTPPIANNSATLHQNDINGSENIEDCEMTEEEMDASSRDLGLAGFDPAYTKSVVQEVTSNGDITVNHAISSNQVTVAGCKRTRETAEGHCYKRQRTAVCQPDSCFEIFDTELIGLDCDDQRMPNMDEEDDEDSCFLDENSNSNAMTAVIESHCLELAEQQLPTKCADLKELVLDGSKQQRNGFLNTLSIQANGLNKFPTNMHQLDLLTKTCPITCPVEQTPDVVSGFTNGHSPHVHNGSFHHVGHLADPSNASSSADEHKDSILLAQGYDSMCYEEMLNQCSSPPF